MRIGVPKERERAERRVALTPESVGRLVMQGLEVTVERDAGEAAGFGDEAYTAAGATVGDTPAAVFGGADLVAKVRRPSAEEVALLRPEATLVALLQPGADGGITPRLAERGVT